MLIQHSGLSLQNLRRESKMESDDKLVVIHQPDFMPYLGFFHRLLIADIYIVLGNVQFVNDSSRSWTNRDKIKTPNGAKWITVPVNKCPRNTMINEVTISSAIDWKREHLTALQINYKNSPCFGEVYPHIEKLYSNEAEYLADFTFASIKMLMSLLDIDIAVLYSSDLNVEGTSNTRIARLVKAVGSHRYLSGIGAKDYYDPEIYKNEGVEVIWQEFTHPVYPQQFDDFITNLSSIDLLFNCGIEKSRKILRGCLQ